MALGAHCAVCDDDDDDDDGLEKKQRMQTSNKRLLYSLSQISHGLSGLR